MKRKLLISPGTASTTWYAHLVPKHRADAVERLVRPTGTATSTDTLIEPSVKVEEVA